MTILLYDQRDLEERASRHLKAWKVWHLILYILAAIFGIVNYVFLRNTMALVNDNCVLYPRRLEFRSVEIPDLENNLMLLNISRNDVDVTTQIAQTAISNDTNNSAKVKRDTNNETTSTTSTTTTTEATTESNNVTNGFGNQTHRWTLDTSRTLFEDDSSCQFAEYMPIMSTIIAVVWATMFTMCAGGGHVRTGLAQPWRILAPALVFASLMVGLTGHSFTLTNGGLHDFCAHFYEYTNTTTCSAVNSYLERGWNTSWTFGDRVAAARAASAGVWAIWACAAALLLARCLAAPDFEIKRTGVYLARDPHQILTPYLKKQTQLKSRRSNNSPTKRDTVSIRSEPTIMTELVTASIEQDQDSVPTSLMATPVKNQRNADTIEMTCSPKELIDVQR